MRRITVCKIVALIPCGFFAIILLYTALDFVGVNPLRAEMARQRVLRSDYKSLIDVSERFVATFNDEMSMGDNGPYGYSRTYWADDGFPAEMPEEIKQLQPLYVTVEFNRLLVRLWGAPRVMMIVRTDEMQEYNAIQVTNKLWLLQ